MPDDSRPDDVIWLPPPDAGRARAIHVALVTADVGEVQLHGIVPIAVIRLSSGEAAVLLTSTMEMDEASRNSLEKARSEGLMRLPDLMALNGRPGIRMAVFGNDSDGLRWVWDTALDPIAG